jgi:sulfotransferase
MDQKLFFLSGIARSGSTLLGSMLNQNPDIHVSPTSPLLDLFCLVENQLQQLTHQYTYDINAVSPNIHRSIAGAFYAHINKPYIIDKHRGWPKNINTVKQIMTPNPRIICTHRHIAENIVSFLKLMRNDPDNSVDRTLTARRIPLTLENRVRLLWEEYSSDPFYSLKDGLENDLTCIHIVRYDDLISDTQTAIAGVYEFLDIPRYENHTFTNIRNTCAESKDEAWGFRGLHDIKPIIAKTSDDPREILGDKLYEFFDTIERQLPIPRRS